MHDLNYFRDHLDVFAEMADKRGATLDLEAFRALDKERRELITSTEQLKAQRNRASEEIARLKKEKQDADALIAAMKQVSEHIKQADERIAEMDAAQREFLLTTPNLPAVGRAPEIRFYAEASLGSRRRRGHTRSGRGDENRRGAIRGLQRLGRAARAGAGEFLSGRAHRGAWLYRDSSAVSREHGISPGGGAAAEICS
jgi:seryl-tRNA synthetase